jgi:hypothetical protein
MDILFTIVASVLLLVGFLVLCRIPDDGDGEEEEEEELTAKNTNQEDTPNGPGKS